MFLGKKTITIISLNSSAFLLPLILNNKGPLLSIFRDLSESEKSILIISVRLRQYTRTINHRNDAKTCLYKEYVAAINKYQTKALYLLIY